MRSRAGMGYLEETSPDGVRAKDTYTCQHCNAIQHIRANVRPEDHGGVCKVCMGLICPRCVGLGCLPIERWLERQENPNRQIGKIYGGWKLHQVK